MSYFSTKSCLINKLSVSPTIGWFSGISYGFAAIIISYIINLLYAKIYDPK